MDNLQVLKLATREEVIGVLKKKYTDGDIILTDVKILVVTPESQLFLDDYLLGGQNAELTFNRSLIITSSPANEKLIDLFTQTITFDNEAAGATKVTH